MNRRPATLDRGRSRGGFFWGFSLVELVIVMVLIGILAAIAVPRVFSTAAMTVSLQADRFAADLRRAQALAASQSRSLCVTVSATRYFVSTFDGTACASSAIADPAGGSFAVDLESGVSISGTAGFRYRGNGAPSAAASFTLSGGDRSVVVDVADVSGIVTVTAG